MCTKCSDSWHVLKMRVIHGSTNTCTSPRLPPNIKQKYSTKLTTHYTVQYIQPYIWSWLFIGFEPFFPNTTNQTMNDPLLLYNVWVNGISFCETTVVFLLCICFPHPVLWALDWWRYHLGESPAVDYLDTKKHLRKPAKRQTIKHFPTECTWPQWTNGLKTCCPPPTYISHLGFKRLFTIFTLICTCGYFDDHLMFLFCLVFLFFLWFVNLFKTLK